MVKNTEKSDETASSNEAAKTSRKINFWMISTAVLALIIIVMFVRGGITGAATGALSKEQAGNKVLQLVNDYLIQDGTATLDSVSDESGLYKVNLDYNSNKIPVYITKDSKSLILPNGIMGIAELEATAQNAKQEQPTEITKTDKPTVEVFVFSYCPYGLQFEKALFPVYDLLKDKVDINIVAIGAMHGEFEKQESLRQISIEQLYGKDKLFAYLKEFDNSANISSCSGEDTCLNKYLPLIYSKLGIDKTKVENYMKSDAGKIYNEQGARASSLGISGSPAFVINGVKVQVSRTADAIKTAVCDAFNTAPSECSQSLSTASPSPGFGSSSGNSGSAASCG